MGRPIELKTFVESKDYLLSSVYALGLKEKEDKKCYHSLLSFNQCLSMVRW